MGGPAPQARPTDLGADPPFVEETPEVKYYVCNGDEETPLSVMALVACTRHQVEDYFEDTKGYLD